MHSLPEHCCPPASRRQRIGQIKLQTTTCPRNRIRLYELSARHALDGSGSAPSSAASCVALDQTCLSVSTMHSPFLGFAGGLTSGGEPSGGLCGGMGGTGGLGMSGGLPPGGVLSHGTVICTCLGH